MFDNILVLCLGNICRSPIAEYLLRDYLTKKNLDIYVNSAGLTAMEGWPAHEISRALMQERGLDLSAHRAKQVTTQHVTQANLILVMDDIQRQMLSKDFPQSAGKTFRIGEFTNTDIPDPYGEPIPAFRHAFALIDAGLQSWYSQLK
jgi:protein-tyrosine phosphatase